MSSSYAAAVWWVIFGSVLLVCGLRPIGDLDGVESAGAAESTGVVLTSGDVTRYEFEIVHRQYVNLQRECDSAEAKLGVLALSAIALMTVYFPDPKYFVDRILEIGFGIAAFSAGAGFMLFRGFEPFDPLEVQRACRNDDVNALRRFAERMVEHYRGTKNAIRAKTACAWLSLFLIALVLTAVSALRLLNATRGAS